MNNNKNPQKINGLKTTQFPVNSNVATIEHKLHGQTKNIVYLLRNRIMYLKIGSMFSTKGKDIGWIVIGK